MKKTLVIILLSIFLSFSLFSLSVVERDVNDKKSSDKNDSKNYVASTSWVASIAYLAGLDNVKIIAPANLKHPPEYEITVDDLVNVVNADLFMNAGYEKMVSVITSSAGLAEDKIVKVKTTNTLDNLTNMVNMLSELENTSSIAKRRFSKVQNLFLTARNIIKTTDLSTLKVYVNTNQAEFASDLGLNVVDTFGSGPLTSDQLEFIAREKPDLIIDNSHAEVASPAKDLSPDSVMLSWSNFPDNTEPDALYLVLLNNVNLLFKAYGLPEIK